MTCTSDPRLIPEIDVHGRATLVTSVAECKHMLGSGCKSKHLDGTVKEVGTDSCVVADSALSRFSAIFGTEQNASR